MKACGGQGGSRTRSEPTRMTSRGLAASVAVAAIAALAGCSPAPEEAVAAHWNMLGRYCTDCHNDAELAGELSFEHVHAERGRGEAGSLGEGRPQAARPPDAAARRAAGRTRPTSPRSSLARELPRRRGRAARARTGPRRAASAESHRVRDGRARSARPRDRRARAAADGRRERRLRQRRERAPGLAVVSRAVHRRGARHQHGRRQRGARRPRARTTAPSARNHTVHVDGLPLGTRDGMLVEHYFPADGTYDSTSALGGAGDELRGYPNGWLEYEHTRRAHDRRRAGVHGRDRRRRRTRCASTSARSRRSRRSRSASATSGSTSQAGAHEVAATFVARSRAEADYLLQPLDPGRRRARRAAPARHRDHRSVRRDGHRRHDREPRARSSSAGRRARPRSCRARRRSSRSSRARRSAGPSTDDGPRAAARVLSPRAARRAASRPASRNALMACSRAPKFLYRAEPGAPPDELARRARRTP